MSKKCRICGGKVTRYTLKQLCKKCYNRLYSRERYRKNKHNEEFLRMQREASARYRKMHKNRVELRRYTARYDYFIGWIQLLDGRFGMRCAKCGYDLCFSAMDFHHFDTEDKDISLSHMLVCNPNGKWAAELDKGTLLCSRCHRELHCSCQGKEPSILSGTTWIPTPLRNWWTCISRRVRRIEKLIEKLRNSL